jgi:hypothetical protein
METPVASIDPWQLAHDLAEIARTSVDPATGIRLMHVVEHLLEAAGLPPDGTGGGEPLPSGWVATMLEDIC